MNGAHAQKMAEINGIRGRDVIKYMVLPGILPRFKTLFGTGFITIAYAMAQIFSAARLIPKTHPYLNPVNFGRYGIVQVIAAAANNLKLDRQHFDQIIIFFTLMAGIVIVMIQIVALALAFMFPNAQAANPINPLTMPLAASMINPPSANSDDIAFIMLDRVFGVEKIFGSCLNTGVNCELLGTDAQPAKIPWPFHKALHAVFDFYSKALLVVGVLLLMYFVFAIAAETAETGTPFGKRFNSVWAPIRLIVAFGLLIPLGSGLNASQYIVLYAAKLGSQTASTGWVKFVEELNTARSGTGTLESKIASVRPPDGRSLLDFFMIAQFCKHTNELQTSTTGGTVKKDIKAYIKIKDTPLLLDTNFQKALEITNGGPITIIFGNKLTPAQGGNNHPHGIEAICGQMTVAANVGGWKEGTTATQYDEAHAKSPAAYMVQQKYYDLIKELWRGSIIEIENGAPIEDSSQSIRPYARDLDIYARDWYLLFQPRGQDQSALPGVFRDQNPESFSQGKRNQLIAAINADLATIVKAALVKANAEDDRMKIDYNDGKGPLVKRGWAGAGIWYNDIAQQNGAYVSAVLELPQIVMRPLVMEAVKLALGRSNNNTAPENQFCPERAGNTPIPQETEADAYNAADYCKLYKIWNTSLESGANGNLFVDLINYMFGTTGLQALKDNTDNVNPLALLASLGKGIIDSVITKMGIGVLGMVGQIMPGTGAIGEAAGVLSGFMFSLAGIGLTAGFILYYVIPFMPFMYFFFAVGVWVKTIFEAMVGAPLWALAHIRIDGQGLPGDAASGGYYLIFEIFLRPILVIFGLVASIIIFTAMASALHEIFDVVTGYIRGDTVGTAATPAAPTSGNIVESARSSVDQFFFLVLYAIIIYLMATSCFKLIDLIPQQILRWMGSQAQSFGDQAGAQVDQMVGYVSIGGSTIFPQMTGALQQAGQGGRSVTEALMNLGKPKT